MRLVFRQLTWEFTKVFARRRTLFGFVACLLAELITAALLNLPLVKGLLIRHLHRAGIAFEGNYSGLTLAASMMGYTAGLLGSLYIAAVVGEIVAKEAEDGTLRTLLCRPITRASIFWQKVVVSATYNVVLNGFIACSALAIGLLVHGRGNLVFWSVKNDVFGWYDFPTGLFRYGLAVLLHIASTSMIAALAFFFSCLPMKPATAAVLALTCFFADEALRGQPAFAELRRYSLMTHISTWLEAYRDPLPWPLIGERYLRIAVFDAALLSGAWLVFRRREFIGP